MLVRIIFNRIVIFLPASEYDLQGGKNAKTIQNFCKDVHNKILALKNAKNLDNYKNLADIVNKIKLSPKEFFERLKESKYYLEDKIIDTPFVGSADRSGSGESFEQSDQKETGQLC